MKATIVIAGMYGYYQDRKIHFAEPCVTDPPKDFTVDFFNRTFERYYFLGGKALIDSLGRTNLQPGIKHVSHYDALIASIPKPVKVIHDPCMGSGTTGIAALANGYDFIGVECHTMRAQAAIERIQAAFPDVEVDVVRVPNP